MSVRPRPSRTGGKQQTQRTFGGAEGDRGPDAAALPQNAASMMRRSRSAPSSSTCNASW